MAYGELNVVRNRENLITFDGEDYVMKGSHLRSQIIKSKGVPMKKRVKGKEVAKNEAKTVNNEEDDGMINEKDVMYAKMETKWMIDDTYKIID